MAGATPLNIRKYFISTTTCNYIGIYIIEKLSNIEIFQVLIFYYLMNVYLSKLKLHRYALTNNSAAENYFV